MPAPQPCVLLPLKRACGLQPKPSRALCSALAPVFLDFFKGLWDCELEAAICRHRWGLGVVQREPSVDNDVSADTCCQSPSAPRDPNKTEPAAQGAASQRAALRAHPAHPFEGRGSLSRSSPLAITGSRAPCTCTPGSNCRVAGVPLRRPSSPHPHRSTPCPQQSEAVGLGFGLQLGLVAPEVG